ncbi:MAG: 2-amino-4-hydroxy-6-hydroxymethyldihydropteridine diphosphokinase [Magnetococcales bacterium]|nr:2-amino-4-hydroxy-6-hydroxymethyldihydropteridine diphosphokinase [Magnetococcales bacterium]
MSGSARVWVGVGGNVGDTLGLCRKVLARLADASCCFHLRHSLWYRSEPVGGVDQPWFVNGVVRFETPLSPLELLGMLLEVESQLGRNRQQEQRWGPRPMDLDLLFYRELIIHHADLVVPHPRLHERLFVLRPLADLDPHLRHPILGKTVDTLLHEMIDRGRVEPISDQAPTL